MRHAGRALFILVAILSPGTRAEITVSSARIGCLDIQTSENMMAIVAAACNGKQSCSYKAPTEDAYKKMGVTAAQLSCAPSP
jgi:hypothetical protein